MTDAMESPDYPIFTAILSEKISTGRSVSLEDWIRDAQDGLGRIQARSRHQAKIGLQVMRSMELAARLIDKMAAAATTEACPR